MNRNDDFFDGQYAKIDIILKVLDKSLGTYEKGKSYNDCYLKIIGDYLYIKQDLINDLRTIDIFYAGDIINIKLHNSEVKKQLID